jgi:hypothetical protein
MKRSILTTVMIFTFILCFAFTGTVKAQLAEGMTQGEFALWLVKAVGALYKLPPGANAQDAFVFLSRLGMVPQGDWQADEKISKEFLASFLDLKADEKSALLSDPKGFDKLAQKVLDLMQSRFDDARQGVFRVQGASGSVPA